MFFIPACKLSYLSSPHIKEPQCVAAGKSFNCCLAERTKPGVSGFHATLSLLENFKIVICIKISNFSGGKPVGITPLTRLLSVRSLLWSLSILLAFFWLYNIYICIWSLSWRCVRCSNKDSPSLTV